MQRMPAFLQEQCFVAHLDLGLQLQQRPLGAMGLLKEARRWGSFFFDSFTLDGVVPVLGFLDDVVTSGGVVAASSWEILVDFLVPDVTSAQLAFSVGWDILTDRQ